MSNGNIGTKATAALLKSGKHTMPCATEAEILLAELVTALEGAFISTWQSTHYWQNQLNDARAWLNQQEELRQ